MRHMQPVREGGATAVEYALLITLIAGFIVVAVALPCTVGSASLGDGRPIATSSLGPVTTGTFGSRLPIDQVPAAVGRPRWNRLDHRAANPTDSGQH